MAKKRHYSSERPMSRSDMGESRSRSGYSYYRTENGSRGEYPYSASENANRSAHQKDHFNDEMHNDRGGENAPFNRFRAGGDHMEFYAGSEPRKRQEMQDSGMIRENPNAIANLPQEVMIKAYPVTGPYMPEGLEDSIRGVDHQMDYGDSQRRAHWYPKKV